MTESSFHCSILSIPPTLPTSTSSQFDACSICTHSIRILLLLLISNMYLHAAVFIQPSSVDSWRLSSIYVIGSILVCISRQRDSNTGMPNDVDALASRMHCSVHVLQALNSPFCGHNPLASVSDPHTRNASACELKHQKQTIDSVGKLSIPHIMA